MIDHVVLLKLAKGHDAAALAEVMAGLAGLAGRIDGFAAFRHGPNRDFERRSADYGYGFTCVFRDAAALDVYARDPAHRALGARLLTLCDDLLVADLESS